jgi:hypothetical protein
MNPDGLSYLDLASEAVHAGPARLLSGYWSPGYPALLTLALALFHPSADREVPLIHLVNFVIFALTLGAFQYFLRGWLALTAGITNDKEKSETIPFAFFLFLWFTLEYVGVGEVTPDLCVAALIFLAAGITCRLSLPGSGGKLYLALGIAFGFAYYAKAAMFPLSALFLAGLLLYPPSRCVTRPKLLLSLAVFLVMAAPLVAVLSTRVGKLSFGETGPLNYAWYVNGLPKFTGWADVSTDAYGTPQHPPRKLMEKPLILEFASPIQGTFPLWYDPSYWNAGARVRFDLRRQVAALRNTLREFKSMISQMTVFLSGAVVLFILVAYESRLSNLPRYASWLLIWPLAAMSMYALVHVESRFLGSFFVLLWIVVFGVLTSRLPRTVGWATVGLAVCATVAGAVMIPFLAHLAGAGVRSVRGLIHPQEPDYEIVAGRLRDLGLRSGDRLAIVGHEYDPYYAQYARLRVVAEIPDADEFWNLSAPELKSVSDRLAAIGVKAIVAANRPGVRVSGAVPYTVLLLPDP